MNVFSVFGKVELEDKGYRDALKRAEAETKTTTTRVENDWRTKLQKVEDRLVSVGRRMQTFGKALTLGVTTPLLAVGTAGIAAATSLGNTADRLLDLEQMTGLSTTTLQEFKNVARQAGVDTEVLSGAAEGLTRRLRAAGPESQTFEDNIARLGISTRTSTGEFRSMDDIMPEILEKLRGMDNITERNSISMQLFGRRATELAPVLGLTAEEFENARLEAHELGDVMSRETLVAANNFRIEQEKLRGQLGNLVRDITISVIPIATSLATMMRERVVPAVKSVTDRIASAVEWFNSLGKGQQSAIGIVAAALAASGPLMLGLGSLLTILPKIRAAIIAVRTVMLAMSGPAGWITLAAIAIGGLVYQLYRRGREDTLEAAARNAARAVESGDADSLSTSLGNLADGLSADSPLRTRLAELIAEIEKTGTVSTQTAAEVNAALASIEVAKERQRVEAELALAYARREELARQQQVVSEAMTERERQIMERSPALYERLKADGYFDVAEVQELTGAIEENNKTIADLEATLESLPVQPGIAPPPAPAPTPTPTDTDDGTSGGAGDSPAVTEPPAPVPWSSLPVAWGPNVLEAMARNEVLGPGAGVATGVNGREAILERMRQEAEQADAEAQAVYDAYLSLMADPERLTQMAESEVGGPGSGMATGISDAETGWRLVQAKRRAAAEANAVFQAYVALMQADDRLVAMAEAEVGGPGDGMSSPLSDGYIAHRLQQARDRADAEAQAAFEAYQEAMADESRVEAMVAAEVGGPGEGMDNPLSDGNTRARLRAVKERAQAEAKAVFDAYLEQMRDPERLAAMAESEVGGPGEGMDTGLSRGNTRARLRASPAANRPTFLDKAMEGLKTFGDNILSIAKEKVPLLGAALDGLATGGPIGALVAVLTEMLMSSEAFQGILEAVNKVLEPLIGMMTTLLDAISPIIEVAINLVELALKPLTFIIEKIVAPVMSFVAKVIAGIWNAFAKAVNWALGWLGVSLPTIDLDNPTKYRPEEGSPKVTPTVPTPAAPEERESQFFGGTPQSVQLAVATPLVEASYAMLDAATRIEDVFSVSGDTGFSALPPFTSAIEMITPVLERLLTEGIDIGIQQRQPSRQGAMSLAYLRV